MTAYPLPRPRATHPEVPWTGPHEGGVVSPMLGRMISWLTWRRAHHEWIRVEGSVLRWSLPGWAMRIESEGDMNVARALVLGLDDATRLTALEAAWAARTTT